MWFSFRTLFQESRPVSTGAFFSRCDWSSDVCSSDLPSSSFIATFIRRSSSGSSSLFFTLLKMKAWKVVLRQTAWKKQYKNFYRILRFLQILKFLAFFFFLSWCPWDEVHLSARRFSEKKNDYFWLFHHPLCHSPFISLAAFCPPQIIAKKE